MGKYVVTPAPSLAFPGDIQAVFGHIEVEVGQVHDHKALDGLEDLEKLLIEWREK